MYQIQHGPKLSASFPTLYVKDKHDYNTTSATNDLFRYSFNKNKYVWEKLFKKDNLKNDFSDIAGSELSLSKIKRFLKQKCFGQY